MKCKKCGCEAHVGDSFCRECGASLSEDTMEMPSYDTMYTYNQNMNRIYCINDKSKPFRIFCSVLAIVDILAIIAGLVTSNMMIVTTAAMQLVMAGIFFAMNNFSNDLFHFRVGRQFVVLLAFMTVMVIGSITFLL